jgi:hypothetical protein
MHVIARMWSVSLVDTPMRYRPHRGQEVRGTRKKTKSRIHSLLNCDFSEFVISPECHENLTLSAHARTTAGFISRPHWGRSSNSMDHKSLVFASVFPVPSISHTTPTPLATPDLGHSSLGASFGGPYHDNASQHRAVKRTVAWSTATRFLSLPRTDTNVQEFAEQKWRLRTRDVEEALEYLLVEEGQSEDPNEESLVGWYTNEVMLHFVSVARCLLEDLWKRVRNLRPGRCSG